MLDLSSALFVDSSFLRNLMRAHRLARDRGTTLRLQLATTFAVRRALEVSNLLDFFDCVSDREQALAPG